MKILAALTLSVVLACSLLAACAAPAPVTTPAPVPTVKPTPTPTPSPSPTPLPKVNWRFQSIYSLTSQNAAASAKLAKLVSQRTNGGFNIEVFAPSALFASGALFDAVGKGAVEGGLSWLTTYSGTVPVGDAKTGYFLVPDNKHLQRLLWETDYIKIIQEECAQHGVYYYGCHPINPLNLGTRQMCNSMADVKGLKIRAYGIMLPPVEACGAVSVTLATAEVYTALQQKTVDGTWNALYAFVDYKMHEVINCIVFPTPVVAVADYIFNLKAWNALPAEYKRVFDTSFKEVWEELAVSQEKADKDAYDLMQKAGVKMVTWSSADVAKMTQALEPYNDQFAKKSKASADVIALLRKEIKR